jgi:hypothetical protein
MSDLEDTFPFTLVRTTNLALSETQTDIGRQYATSGNAGGDDEDDNIPLSPTAGQ